MGGVPKAKLDGVSGWSSWTAEVEALLYFVVSKARASRTPSYMSNLTKPYSKANRTTSPKLLRRKRKSAI